MEAPLINSTPAVGLIGKSYNKHPQWFNQPLRLAEEQLDNPILAFEDFFQSYHLNDVRELLWQWLIGVISSNGSISSEPLDRNNHMYFYEKLEEVIEAAFILKNNNLTAGLNATAKDAVGSPLTTELETSDILGTIFLKGKRLIEFVNDDPLYVIESVFNPGKWAPNCLQEWVEIGLGSEDTAYCDADDRKNLVFFKDHLHLIIESLYIIYLQRISDSSKKEWSQKVYTPHLLSKEKAGNPRQVIKEFFEKFPMLYIQRELEDLLEAGISHTGPWPNEITSPWHVYDTYRDILCLIKSAEQLLIQNFSTII